MSLRVSFALMPMVLVIIIIIIFIMTRLRGKER